MTIADLGYFLAGTLALLAAAAKLHQARTSTSRSAGLIYLCMYMSTLGLACFMLAPSGLRFLAGLEPIPNLTRLAGNGLTACAVYSIMGTLSYAAYPRANAARRMRLQLVVLVGTLVTMTVLLLTANTKFSVDFVNAQGIHPTVVAYMAIFLGYNICGAIVIIRLATIGARHATARFVSAGLRIIRLGAWISLAWAVWKLTMTVIKAAGRPVPMEGPVSAYLSAAAVWTLAAGVVLPNWGPRITQPFRWLRARRDHRRLKPLWADLTSAMPDVVLPLPATTDMEFRLYRKTIEIRDAGLRLRVFAHPEASAWTTAEASAAGVTDEDQIAVLVDAANFATALEAWRANHRYHEDPSTADVPREIDPSVAAEARWLALVADAVAHSPIVADVRQRVQDELITAHESRTE